MSFSPPTSGASAPLLSSDEMVNELCAALLAHEAFVRAARANATRHTQFELEQIMRKIARCEGWLRMLGKHATLANVRARMPSPAGAVVQPSPRIGLDVEVDRALRRQTLPTRAVPRPTIVPG